MANQPARFRKCELRRAQQVAEECDRIVKIEEGVIYIVPNSGDIGDKSENSLDQKPEGYL